MNVNTQLDKIIEEQLKNVYTQMDSIPEGEQKEFLRKTIESIKVDRKLDAMEFVSEFSKVKGDRVDFNKLREMAQKIKI